MIATPCWWRYASGMTALAYQSRQPEPELAPFVESFWSVANHSDQSKNVTLMPDGRVDLHFFVSPCEAYHVAIAGLECEPSPVTIAPGSVLVAVSFKLLAMEYVLNASTAAILNNRAVVPPEEWGIAEAELADFDLCCRKLSARIRQILRADVDIRKQKMFELIYASQGAASVSEIADSVQWSSRQINRYFNQWFGLSLKAYSSILRFRASLGQIGEGKLYPEDFFFDQAHFIKDIKKYSGHTPKQLYKNQDDRFIQLLALKKT